MSLFAQILFGSTAFGICAAVHIALVALSVPLLARLASWSAPRRPGTRVAVLLAAAFGMVVVVHTVQIWGWAILFLKMNAFSDMGAAFYFSVVTYTTLGYGDMVLGPGLRVFAAFAAITGLLTFGISTAFLLAVITRVLPERFGTRNN